MSRHMMPLSLLKMYSGKLGFFMLYNSSMPRLCFMKSSVPGKRRQWLEGPSPSPSPRGPTSPAPLRLPQRVWGGAGVGGALWSSSSPNAKWNHETWPTPSSGLSGGCNRQGDRVYLRDGQSFFLASLGVQERGLPAQSCYVKDVGGLGTEQYPQMPSPSVVLRCWDNGHVPLIPSQG